MSQLLQHVFSADHPDAVPRIFSKTENFRFDSDVGRAIHTVLPSGPKGFGVFRVSSTGHQATLTEQSRNAVSIQLAGCAEVNTGRTTFVAGPGDVTILGPSRRHIRLHPKEMDTYISYSVVAPADFNEDLVGTEVYGHRPDHDGYAQLRELLDYAYRMFSVSDANFRNETIRAAVEVLIEEMFREALCSRDERVSSCRERHRYDRIVNRARDYVVGRCAEPITVFDMAREAKTTVRTLQNACRDRLGLTPREFLADFRLQEMRRRLENAGPETTVTCAAHEAGFVHMGRASKAYRDRFGEPPSVTLKRTRNVSAAGRPRISARQR